MRLPSRAREICAGLVAALALFVPGVAGVHAQELPLKRPAASVPGPDCPPHPPSPAQRLTTRQVDSLLSAGSQASIMVLSPSLAPPRERMPSLMPLIQAAKAPPSRFSLSATALPAPRNAPA